VLQKDILFSRKITLLLRKKNFKEKITLRKRGGGGKTKKLKLEEPSAFILTSSQ